MDGDADAGAGAAAGGIFGRTKPAGLTQPSNVVSVQSTPGTNPFGNLPAMPQITIGRSTGSDPSVQHGISSMPVSFFSAGDDTPSTSKADVMSIPSSSYDQSPASSCSLPSYSYKPLDIGRKEIRLIKLQAPIKSQPLCGNIIHVPLTAELGYWALSYCWGSLGEKRTIILDGMKLLITVNLDDALRQLGNSYGMLWVDAICINQEDIPERSREVLRMGEIYSLASGVAAWLGVADKTSNRAMDFLRVLATREPRSQYDEYLQELPSEDDFGKFGNEWIALKDLVRNGYWSRTWIIQELVLNRHSKIVHCGTKSLPWDNFLNVLGDSIFCECILDAIFPDSQEFPEVASGLSNLQMFSLFEHNPGFGDKNVFNLLWLINRFQATDPRDYIYGILALSVELRQLVPHPNYALSKEVVFRDLTKAMLASGYNLDLICYKHPAHVNQSDVVSWVPRWDVRGPWIDPPDFLMQALGDNHSRGAYSADAGKDAIISYVGDGSVLRVRGIFYDRVDGLGSTELPGSLRSTKDAIEPDHKQNAYGSDADTFMALKQLSQEIFRVFKRGAAQDGSSLNNECLIPRVYQQIALMDPDSSSTKSALEWLQRTKEFSFVGRSLQQWYEMAFTHGEASPLASSSSNVQMDPELDGMLMCLEFVTQHGWRWLSTDRGYLGQTHPQTQKGDEIMIVQGCTIPMVLRPCGQHYSVVCAAYVQGIMHGEALEGVSDDQIRYFDLA